MTSEECHVTISIGEKEYECDKNLLIKGSGYFRSMFSNSFNESFSQFIQIKEDKQGFISSKTFSYFLKFLKEEISDSDEFGSIRLLQDCLVLSDYFNSPQFKSYLENELTSHKNLTSESSIRSYLLAELCQAELLLKESHDKMRENMKLASSSEEFLLLSAAQLFSCFDKNENSSEFEFLEILLKWLEAFPTFADEMFRKIRPGLIKLEQIKEIEVPDILQSSFNSCLLSRVIDYHSEPFRQPFNKFEENQIRNESEYYCQIDGVQCDTPLRLNIHFEPSLRNAMNLEMMKEEHENYRDPNHSVVQVNGFIFSLGERRKFGRGVSRDFIRYDPRTGHVTRLAPMKFARGDFYACYAKGFIFVFGGKNQNGQIKHCEKYDIINNSWSCLTKLPRPLSHMAGCISRKENLIFLSGGYDKYEATNQVIQYDITNNKFEMLPSLIYHRAGHMMIMIEEDKCLLVIGGNDNPYNGRLVWKIEVFSPVRSSWMMHGHTLPVGPFTKVNRLNYRMSTSGDSILVWAIDFLNTGRKILEYNLKGHRWTVHNHSIVLFDVLF